MIHKIYFRNGSPKQTFDDDPLTNEEKSPSKFKVKSKSKKIIN